MVGGSIPEPRQFGIDVIFPAAMIGLAVGLISGRREVVAAISGALIGVVVALVAGAPIGIIAGGLLGPAIGLLVPGDASRETAPLGSHPSAARYSMPGIRVSADEPPEPPEPPGASR
jgi:predicted branched-subunit amino acid permease